MNADRQDAHPTAAVNGGLFAACLFGTGAWMMWPSSLQWWGLGFLSIMLGMGAVAGLAGAIKAMVARYLREREIYRYLSQGGGPKSARLASDADLKRAGMIE